MPIYAFECARCGHRFDRLQKLSDPDPEVCPTCGEAAMRRQITAPTFRLAGSGWYETDFKKDGEGKRNLSEKSEGAAKPDSGEAKPAEAKPETKPAPKPEAAAKPETKPATKPAAD